DIRLIHCLDRTDNGIEFEIFFHLGLAPDTGGIDEDKILFKEIVPGMDGIAGGAGDVADDGAFLADEGVQERGLADIGLTDDGEFRQALLIGMGLVFLDKCRDGVEKLAGSAACHRRKKIDLVEAQGIEFRCFEQAFAIVYFIDDEENGFGGAAQHIGHGFIKARDTGSSVDHEDQRISFFQGDEYLFFYLDLEDIVALGYEATGVDEVEAFAGPFRHAILAIAGNAADVVDDGFALLEQAIKKCTFPYIGPAYDGYCKSAHILI